MVDSCECCGRIFSPDDETCYAMDNEDVIHTFCSSVCAEKKGFTSFTEGGDVNG
jgi:hypothetical protein